MSGNRRSTATLLVMVSTFGSRILGFIRIAVIGAIFGASGSADVLNLVFNIPNNLRKLLAEGALSSAFVPALSRAHVEAPDGLRARRIVQQLLGLQLLILIPLLTLAALFPRAIVNVILDFPELQRQALAAELFRYLIHYTLLISLAAVLMGLLNSLQLFLVPALAPLLFSVAVIASILLFHEGLGIFSVVVGVLAGGMGQLLIQIPPVLRRGYSILPRIDLRDPHIRAILARWLPVVGTSSIFVINQQVALFLASGLADGSGSALTNALVFWQLPFGIFGASITTVLFPAMSRHFAAGSLRDLHDTLMSGLRGLIYLLIPSGVGLIVLGEPIIAVALQRGAFDAEASIRTAAVLAWYSPGLLGVAAFTFLQRLYYACDNYRVPLAVSAVTVILDIGLSLWLKETRMGVTGLALANSIAFTTGTVLLLLALPRVGLERRGGGLGIALLRALAVSAAATLAVAGTRRVVVAFGVEPGWHLAGSSLAALGLLLLEAVAAALVLVGLYALFGVGIREALRGRPEGSDSP